MAEFSAEQVINGLNGVLEIEGDDGSALVGNIMNITANTNIERRALKIAGKQNASFKRMGWSGEGTMVVWRVNSMFYRVMQEGASILSPMPQFNIRISLTDPDLVREGESFLSGNNLEELLLKKVKFWTFDWGFNVEELLEQSVEFTYEAIELVSPLGVSGIESIYTIPDDTATVTGG